jgi:hypothetical protein
LHQHLEAKPKITKAAARIITTTALGKQLATIRPAPKAMTAQPVHRLLQRIVCTCLHDIMRYIAHYSIINIREKVPVFKFIASFLYF